MADSWRRVLDFLLPNLLFYLLIGHLIDQNALFIGLKCIITLEFGDQGPVQEHFLLDHFHCWREVVPTNIIAVCYFGDCGAVAVVWAMGPFRLWHIRSALFWSHVPIFSQEAMENGPASITTLVHVVTLHQELWWESCFCLLAKMCIFQFRSCLDSLDEP